MSGLIKFLLRKRREFWLWQCAGRCITTGPFYGMAQSHCRRCGKRTNHAAEGQPEQVEPWGEYAPHKWEASA